MSSKRPTGAVPAESLALYDKLVATNPEIDRKGATVPYTSLNGNMFSYMSKDGALNLRLPEHIRLRFLKKHRTSLTKAYGIVQKEYVVVPASLLKKTAELKRWFDGAFCYAKSLKPKATRKPK